MTICIAPGDGWPAFFVDTTAEIKIVLEMVRDDQIVTAKKAAFAAGCDEGYEAGFDEGTKSYEDNLRMARKRSYDAGLRDGVKLGAADANRELRELAAKAKQSPILRPQLQVANLPLLPDLRRNNIAAA